jgi:hypothetical protein
MKKLTCVCWDDNLPEAERVARAIEAAWKSGQPNVPINPIATDDFAGVRNLLDEVEPQLFVCDLLRKEGGRSRFARDGHSADGVELIREAHGKHPRLAIMAVSGGPGELKDRSQYVGADDFVSKDFVLQSPSVKLYERVYAVLQRHGHEPNPYDEGVLSPPDPEDLPLIAELEMVGHSRLVFFGSELVGGHCRRIVPHYVTSGLSGATVFALECYLATAPGVPAGGSQRVLLKVARDHALIEREYLKREELRFFPELFVPIYDDPPLSLGGWHAIGAVFQRGAETLHDWLTGSAPKPEEVVQRLDDLLFKQGLAATYDGAVAREGDLRTAFRTILSVGRAARVKLAMRELREVIRKHVAPELYDEELLHTFLIDPGTIGKADLSLASPVVYVSKCHGDLHTRNVLHVNDGRLLLIDPANIDDLHWATDIVRLLADLLVASWDCGEAAYEWHHLERWLEIARCVARRQPILHETDSAPAVVAAMEWLVANLSRIYRVGIPLRTWEFTVMFAIELLRAAYRRAELPPPKRVFALIAATATLRVAEEEILAALGTRRS